MTRSILLKEGGVQFILTKRKLFHLVLQSCKPLLKRTRRISLCLKIHKNMSILSNMCMDRKKWILHPIKSLHSIHLGSLDKFPSCIVGPSVIFATHDQCASHRFLENRESTVATNIVECADLLIFAFDHDEWISCNGKSAVGSRFVKVRCVSCVQPCLQNIVNIVYS